MSETLELIEKLARRLDDPDRLDESQAALMPRIKYRPRGPLGNLVAGLMNLARGATDAGRRAVEAQLAEGYTPADILPIAVSSILGDRQIQETGPTGPVVLPEEDALKRVYLEGLESLRDEFGNLLSSDDSNLTEADRARRYEWEAAGGQGQFDTNLWDW